MVYIMLAAVIIFVSSVRGLSFAFWQFRRKNIAGGIMTALICILPAVLICMKFRG